MERKKELTNQEKAVLSEILKGRTNPEIADCMKISVHTVKVHIENIYFKLEVHNKVQAAVKALVNNLLD